MSSEQTLTYTPNYGAKLTDIKVNTKYTFAKGKILSECDGKLNFESGGSSFSFRCVDNLGQNGVCEFCFEWHPKEGETSFAQDESTTIIDYAYINDKYGKPHTMIIIDNYGNIHRTRRRPIIRGNSMEWYSFANGILRKKDQEPLSDQVIDYIQRNNIVCNPTITSEHIKQIQELAGMGREKTITYTVDSPCETVEIVYDKNDILKDLMVSFPGCDPWEKAEELQTRYDISLKELMEESDRDTETMNEFVRAKTNIEKVISRNRDIDDEDIRELIEMKKAKLSILESQIDDILVRNHERRVQVTELKVLLSKLNHIPEKTTETDFI